ncbi:PTS sugar transporter subunit IIA [candidate division FCPU426 bacterium]|nr:PTS sugar transporter subunit IIA [candidate division FCPU426 bacterium]
MRIMDFLSEKNITVDLKAKNKKEAIEELVGILVENGNVTDKKKMVQILLEREELGSTGIGQGIAIPHGKSDSVKELTAAFGLSKTGVPFDALDGEPVFIFFLLVAPEGTAGAHLKALARISGLLKDKYIRRKLMAAQSTEEIVKIIQEEEKATH